jgi:hypothetical protein
MQKSISVPFKDLTTDFIDGLETKIRAMIGVKGTLVHWDSFIALVWFDSNVVTASWLQNQIRLFIAQQEVMVLPH